VERRLHQYITGIFQANDHKMICINSLPDHIHALIGLRPHQSISALIQNVKTESSKWIKEQNFCSLPFALAQRLWSVFLFKKSFT
jgi:REP element-mobilizing transposase RayT